MNKFFLLTLIFINSFSFSMNDHAGQKRKTQAAQENIKKQKLDKEEIIKAYKSELLKIIKPGIQSFIAGSQTKSNFYTKDPNHNGDRTLVAWSNNNAYLAVRKHGEIHIFPSTKVQPIVLGDYHNGYHIKGFCISNCSNYIALASVNYINFKIEVWDVSKQRCIKTFNQAYKRHLFPVDIAIDKSLRFILVGLHGYETLSWAPRAWNLKSQMLILDLNLDNSNYDLRTYGGIYPTTFCLSDCGKFLMLGGYNGELSLVDIRNYPELRYKSLDQAHKNSVKTITISSNGKYAITGSDDALRIWDFEKLTNLMLLDLDEPCKSMLYYAALNAQSFVRTIVNKRNCELSNNFEKKLTQEIGEIRPRYGTITRGLGEISLTENYGTAKYDVGMPTLTHDKNGNEINQNRRGVVVFDISDLDDPIVKELNIQEKALLSKDNKYLILLDSKYEKYQVDPPMEGTVTSVAVVELSSWAINDLSQGCLLMLIKLIQEQDPNKIVEYYKAAKDNFTETFQKYIERYLRNRLAGIYLTKNTNSTMKDTLDILSQYLGI